MGKTVTAVRVELFSEPVRVRFLGKNPRGVRYTLDSVAVETAHLDRAGRRDAIAAALSKRIPDRDQSGPT